MYGNRTIESIREEQAANVLAHRKRLQAMPKLDPVPLMSCIGWSLLLACIDMSVVSNAMKPLAAYFDESQLRVSWTVTGYSIALASFSILAGKIGDRYSSTVVHRYGLIAFTLCSALCGSAQSLNQLIGFRIIQGIAAAFMLANAMSLTTTVSEPSKLPTTMAINSLCATVGSALGPPVGGILTDMLSWRWIFYINLVPAIGSLIACYIKLPVTPRMKEPLFDWQGSVFMLFSLSLTIYGIISLENSLAEFFLFFGVGMALLAGTVYWEAHHPCAIFPRRLMATVPVIQSLLAGLINFGLNQPTSYLLPFVLQWSYGLSPSQSGFLTLTRPLVSIFIGCRLSAYWNRLYTAQIVRTFALAGNVLVLFCVAASVNSIFWMISFNMLLGITSTTFVTANNAFSMQATPVDLKGVMGGCIQLFREIGFSAGTAITAVFDDLFVRHLYSGPIPDISFDQPPGYEAAYNRAFSLTTMTVACFAFIAIALVNLAGVAPHEVKQGRVGHQGMIKALAQLPAAVSARLADRKQARADAKPAQGKDEATIARENSPLLSSSPLSNSALVSAPASDDGSDLA
jgi:MFS family permease